MSQTEVKGLSLKAKLALIDLEREFRNRLNQIDMAKAVGALLPAPGRYKALSDEYERRIEEICREGMVDTANDRYVRVKCPSCGRTDNIAGDVLRWTCVCGTAERHTFQTLSEDLR